jgi:hypothetical protein
MLPVKCFATRLVSLPAPEAGETILLFYLLLF